jgi:hypothetical protein
MNDLQKKSDKLLERGLRPVEWYNLARHHSWNQFLLHDDFYDEDGTATQPETPILDAGNYPAPSLKSVAHSPELLLDYSITRWSLGVCRTSPHRHL